MSKENWSNILSVLARTAVAFVFVFGQTAWAMQGQKGKDKPGSSTARGENPSSQGNTHAGGQHEGIKVHGHWTIEVRNPDGSVVTHREFENSLQSSGGTSLASILAGTASPGMWEIRLNGNPSAPSPCPPAPTGFRFLPANDTSCVILSSVFALSASSASSNVFPNLTVNSSGTGQLVLNGNAIASRDGGVAIVSSYLGSCFPSMPPSTCGQTLQLMPPQFTAVTLSPAQVVQVTAGQTIAVTVNISFS
jgi:hypothetical protein